MAWAGGTRSFKDAASATRQAIINATDVATEDVFLHGLTYGATGASPTLVTGTAGLPIKAQRLAGVPTDGSIANPTASATSTGNSIAVGGTGGSALPGAYIVTAHPDNASVISLGGTTANAATGQTGNVPYMRGLPLQPGQAQVIDTDDLRSWKFAVRTAADGLSWVKVGS